MKYILLIHQGAAPTPRDVEAWARLSEDEQNAVYADYKAINETPGVTPGLQMENPETATTVRIEDGKTLIGYSLWLRRKRNISSKAKAR